MSYILDALRRAEAERERGAVPGLHARPALLGDVDSETPPRSRGLKWAVVGLVLVLLAVPVWWFVGGEPARPVAEPVVMAPVIAPVMPIQQAPVVAPVQVQALAPPATSAPIVPTAESPRKPPVKVATSSLPKAPTAPALKPPVKAAVAPASAPVLTEARLYLLSELPDDIRRELPTLAIGGAMYSQNPANRMLIVNGQTFHEGDKLAPNLALEQIKLKSAVLDYKGYRYGITY